MNSLTHEQKSKLKIIIENINQNGKPRPSSDFNINIWKKFYPENDPFFAIEDITIIHNQLKIYFSDKKEKIRVYQGDLNLIGQRHGIGKLTTSKFELIGMWKFDTFSGWGRESRCNGDLFEGRFDNGILNGKGIFMNKKNNRYIGNFKNMKRCGKGKLFTNKIIYEGDFDNDQIHGYGIIKFLQNPTNYIGRFYFGKIEKIKKMNVSRKGKEEKGKALKINSFQNIINILEKKYNNNIEKNTGIIKSIKNREENIYLSTYRNYGFIDTYNFSNII